MKKYLSKILVSLIMLAVFLAPVSPVVRRDKNDNLVAKMEVNEARAAITTMSVKETKITDVSASFNIVILNTAEKYKDNGLSYALYDEFWNYATQSKPTSIKVVGNNSGIIPVTIKAPTQTKSLSLNGLSSNKEYFLIINLMEEGSSSVNFLGGGVTTSTGYIISSYIRFKTASSAEANDASVILNDLKTVSPIHFTVDPKGNVSATQGLNLGCVILGIPPNIVGCVAQLLYVFWEASAWVARLAGHFLDFLIYYSTNDTSYRNSFVEQGWAAVRDIANIFLIIALLYVAIQTILGLKNNKKLIGVIVIVALIINFSLFATKLVIDGSNILAKVFYNNITPKDINDKNLDAGAGGQKSISIGIVRHFNPQDIVSEQTEYDRSPGTFIFVTIMALVITLYTAFIFFSVALLFVGRVIMLWLAMIFSPIAFASYTVSFELPGFGHKKWWSDLLNNALLAPVFIFILYIIVLFAGFLETITLYPTGSETTQKLMGITIPFIIIYILLKKSKELAVQYSGELGKSITGAGKVIAGVAGGVAGGLLIGGVAAGLQGTAGHLGKLASESATMKEWGLTQGKGLGSRLKRFVGSSVTTVGDRAKRGSFDIRTGILGAGLGTLSAATGLNLGQKSTLWKREAGGYDADLKRKDEKKRRRIEERSRVEEGEPEKKALHKAEYEQQELLRKTTKDSETGEEMTIAQRLDKFKEQIDYANEAVRQAREKATAPTASEADKNALKTELEKREALLEKKKELREGTSFYEDESGNRIYNTVDGKISNTKVKNTQKDFTDAEAEKIGAEKEAEGIKSEAEKAKSEAEKAKNDAIAEVEKAREKLEKTTGTMDKFALRAARDRLANAERMADNVSDAYNKVVKDTDEAINTANSKLSAAVDKFKKAEIKKNDIDEIAKGGTSHSIAELETKIIPEASRTIQRIEKERAWAAANILANKWAFPWNKTAREQTAHRVRMGAKLDSGEKH